MNAVVWTLRVSIVLLLAWFAAKNADTVTLYGWLDSRLQAPLVLVLLIFFGAGLLLGLVSSLLTIVKLKREVRRLNRALQHRGHGSTPQPVSPVGDKEDAG